LALENFFGKKWRKTELNVFPQKSNGFFGLLEKKLDGL
jgi:hypothetical protein